MLPGGNVIVAFPVVPRIKTLRMEENFALGAIIRRSPNCFNASGAHFSSIGAFPTFTDFLPVGTVTSRLWFGLLKDVLIRVNCGSSSIHDLWMAKEAFDNIDFELSGILMLRFSVLIHVAIDIVSLRKAH